ncbi:MAG: M24 family metallopeptidase [Acidimicrobiia bacterium]
MTDLRTSAVRYNSLLQRRLDQLVPELLDENGVDCWILIGREYAEDPVLASMLPAEWLSARRRTILVLTRDDRFAIARYPVGDLFRSEWDPEDEPDQWARLVETIHALDPSAIAVGRSEAQAHADGLTATEYEALLAALPDHLASRVVDGGTLGIRWLETRLPEERSTYVEAVSLAHRYLRRGLSSEAIFPGETTTDDLVWWYRQTLHDEGIPTWFQPSVSIQRDGPIDSVIRPGDLVHVDFGIVHEGLCTDQQEHAYVLGNDSEPPAGLSAGLRTANRAQDVLLSCFAKGATGNEILSNTLRQLESESIDALIYTHSIGIHGHGAGMTIGLWDQQDGVPGAGDHRLQPNSAYSIELSVAVPVDEWGGAQVRIMVEQDAWFDGDICTWLDGRQTVLHSI